MFKQLKAVGTIYENYMIKRGRVAARRILLIQDDKTLSDIGISRQELLGGIKNWPWDGSATAQQQDNRLFNEFKVSELKAIRELHKYSNRELQDIGINRGMIVDAVKNGRPTYDEHQPQRATSKVTKKQVA